MFLRHCTVAICWGGLLVCGAFAQPLDVLRTLDEPGPRVRDPQNSNPESPGPQLPATQLPATQLPATQFQAARALEGAMVAAIARAERSVVAIARGRRGDPQERSRLNAPNFVPYEFGTGVVVDRNGLILTNYHVLGDVDKHDYVVWIGGKAYPSVRVKAADPWTDLAVLEIKSSNLTPIEFGSAKNLKKGRIVIALGNPHAIARDGNVSATWGIVSNMRRIVDGPVQGRAGSDIVPLKDRETRYQFGGLLQTDCRLVRGTSGGPLLDLDGKMVGLTTNVAMLAGFEKGAGYAIPVDEVFLRVVEKLKRGEEIEQGFLGVAPRNPDPDVDEVGVVLERVERGTPAGNSGMRAFDQIVEINGNSIRSTDDLFLQIGSVPPEQVAQIIIRRGDRRITKQVQLTKKPLNATRPVVATSQSVPWRGLRVDYATAIAPLRLSSLDPNGCVVVKSVLEYSAAWKAGLRVGQMISHVDEQRVSRPQDFRKAVRGQADAVQIWTFDLSGRGMVVVD